MKRLFSKLSMNVIYAGEQLPQTLDKSIFLAGPTPRSNDVESWRKEALQILEEMDYDGTVFIPEPRNGEKYPDYSKQIDWETQMLDLCDCILFWMPRNMQTLPALTSNIEWGKYQRSEKVVIGFPKDAEHVRYIQYECDKLQIPVHDNLNALIKFAMDFVGDGSHREDGECYVPLNIWKTPMFQNWYSAQKSVGNVLNNSRVNYVFKMPIAKKIFLWVLYVNVFIKSENRNKDNEFVLSRSDISSVVIYRKDQNDIMNSDIVLVKEFRSPGCNKECMVYEIPGGSSISDKDPLETMISEIEEETGLNFSVDRIKQEKTRQLMATLSSHKCYLYSIEMTDEELKNVSAEKGSVHGVIEDTERTYLDVVKLRDILESELLDWSNIGFILSVLNK